MFVQNIADAHKLIPAFGVTHFILSSIPVVSYVVEKGMFKRASSELTSEMLQEKKITKLESFEQRWEFHSRLAAKEGKIALLHCVGAMVQIAALKQLLGPTMLAKVLAGATALWYTGVLINTQEYTVTVGKV